VSAADGLHPSSCVNSNSYTHSPHAHATHQPAQARKLEGELDVKLASYAKLCSGFEASPGPSSEQVGTTAAPAAAFEHCRQSTADSCLRARGRVRVDVSSNLHAGPHTGRRQQQQTHTCHSACANPPDRTPPCSSLHVSLSDTHPVPHPTLLHTRSWPRPRQQILSPSCSSCQTSTTT
jgi:hypothetical protein